MVREPAPSLHLASELGWTAWLAARGETDTDADARFTAPPLRILALSRGGHLDPLPELVLYRLSARQELRFRAGQRYLPRNGM